MDILTFISNTLGQVLSWPVAAFAIALVFRRPIIDSLKEVRKLKTKFFEADFGERLSRVEEEIEEAEESLPAQQDESAASSTSTSDEPQSRPSQERPVFSRADWLSELAPNTSILEAWRNVEATMQLYLSSRGIEARQSGQSILRQLDYDPHFPPGLVSAYQELRILRNRVAHSEENVGREQAERFLELSGRLNMALIRAAEMPSQN